MERDQDALPTVVPPVVERARDAVVIGPEDLVYARGSFVGVQIPVARDLRMLAHGRYRVMTVDRPIAVDDQARVGLQNQGRVETGREEARHLRGADVPGDVPPELGFLHAQIAEPPRKITAGVLTCEKEG